jgi:threonine dehydrogenase-like Zn-dependent dehydrogenase
MLSATCICRSDLWLYCGLQPQRDPADMGHEYCGVVIEVGWDVHNVKPGQFVVGSFCLCDTRPRIASPASNPPASRSSG